MNELGWHLERQSRATNLRKQPWSPHLGDSEFPYGAVLLTSPFTRLDVAGNVSGLR